MLLSKASHHGTHYATLSGTVGRRVFLEYQGMNPNLQGGPTDRDDARLARIDKVWKAASPSEFAAAAHDTGASHLIEYAQCPLACHPSDCLEEFWSSQTGKVKLWTFLTRPCEREAPAVRGGLIGERPITITGGRSESIRRIHRLSATQYPFPCRG